LLPQAPAEGVWNVEVGGRVLDPDGSPIPGAAVLVGSEDGSEASVAAHSDELGYYRIDAVDRRLLIWAADRERASSERQLICSSSLDQVDLRLGYPVGTLAGRILSFEGHPVPRAEVVLIGSFKRFVAGDPRALSMPALPARVWTVGDGSFRLGLPSTRKARLLVLADGHAPLVKERAGQDITLTLPAPCRLEGTLLQPDGSPACGARLGLVFPDPLPERETTTDQAGTFRFDNLPSGPHVLRLLADLDRPSLFLEGGLTEGERAQRTVRLAEEHTIRGRALDGNSPLAGWTVELEDLQNKEEFRRELRRTRTGADGRFAFPSCSLANAHALRLFDPAAAHGMAAVAREVRAGNGALTLRPGDATSRPGSIVGRLESHDPILRPRIATLRGDSLTEPLLLLVDPVTGDFSAAPLPPGWYSLRAWIAGSGLWNAAQTIEIHPGRQAEFFVQVPEPGRLVVRLDLPEDADWAELNAPYIAPSFHDSDSEAHSLRLKKCREESSLKADLFPGNYTYSLRRGRVVLETRRVTIEPGRTTIENVPLREGVSVVLRLSFPRGLEEKEEVVLCTREEDQQRTIGLPHRYRASAATNRVLLTPDTEELRVRTSLGLTGRFAVTGADIRPNAELQIRLEECASD
jgi:hypothetical protein